MFHGNFVAVYNICKLSAQAQYVNMHFVNTIFYCSESIFQLFGKVRLYDPLKLEEIAI